ncbi:unnamed protein product [Macrosiphum euphorbiae]|uniref:Uncharacterized protein n=1 Tax=Macrosiphum euphorbiae TaxID=13131 RepID=A0AAV0WIT1_9HEMI|nr:unnamed protein product [Macrosiphum euphorbiae]
MIPDDNLCSVIRHIPPTTIRHIAKYSFAHSERDVYEYFRQTHSAFVVREVRYSFNGYIVDIFCSFECANYFNQTHFSSNLDNLRFDAFHIMFKEINVLMYYCQRRRCITCQKYTTVCDSQNSYAEPSEDYIQQVYPIFNYTADLLQSTVHT